MKLKDFIHSSRERLRNIYPSEEAACIVAVVARELLGVEAYMVHVDGDMELPVEAGRLAENAVCRLEKHEPLQYVLGFSDFYGRRFSVNRSVLIPRPETETLCREAIAYGRSLGRSLTVLDICTGSGCIAWTMAAELAGNCDRTGVSQVVGIDISADAIEVARSQRLQNFSGMKAPRFHTADIFDDDAMDTILSEYGKFDMVLSNPPYILENERALMRRNVLDHEPHAALFVPDAEPMVFNRKIKEIFEKFSYMDSALFIEINENEGPQTETLLQSGGRLEARVLKDDFGRNRVAMALWKPHQE